MSILVTVLQLGSTDPIEYICEIYCKKLAPTIMEAEKSPNLWSGWKPAIQESCAVNSSLIPKDREPGALIL